MKKPEGRERGSQAEGTASGISTDALRQVCAGGYQEDRISQSGWKRVSESRPLGELRKVRTGGQCGDGLGPVGVTSLVLSMK